MMVARERTQSRRDHREFPNSRLAKNSQAVAWPSTKKSPVWFLERGTQNQNWGDSDQPTLNFQKLERLSVRILMS